MRWAVFLDRDGTINEDIGYLSEPGQLRFIKRSAEAMRMLNRARIPAVIITNQAGIAKGLIPESAVAPIERRFRQMLNEERISIDGLYYCPHHPDAVVEKYRKACSCRKPAPGMLFRAAGDCGLDLARSFVVGDKASDIQLAHNVGATGVMVMTGYGREHMNNYPPEFSPPHHACADLYEAVKWILAQRRLGGDDAGLQP